MKKTFSIAFATVLIAAGASSASAATGISIDNIVGAEYDTAGVFVQGDLTFTGTTDDGGGMDSVSLQIYDDFDLKFDQAYSLAVGDTGTFHFSTSYPGLVGTIAPGIGIYAVDNGDYAVVLDPYYLPHYSDPSQCQRDCGPVGSVPEPSTWAMMLFGFGMAGGAMRFSRRKVKVNYAAA
jgi:PEP-CTERM motif-containing protein